MSNNNDYHLFPNHNKTKMNVISFSLEEKKKMIQMKILIFASLN